MYKKYPNNQERRQLQQIFFNGFESQTDAKYKESKGRVTAAESQS